LCCSIQGRYTRSTKSPTVTIRSAGTVPLFTDAMCRSASALMSAGGCLPRVVASPIECVTRLRSTMQPLLRRSQYRTYQRCPMRIICPSCFLLRIFTSSPFFSCARGLQRPVSRFCLIPHLTVLQPLLCRPSWRSFLFQHALAVRLVLYRQDCPAPARAGSSSDSHTNYHT